jgi:hypothetical protein
MKCHYVYDDVLKQKVLIPGCWEVVRSDDISRCTCGCSDDISYAQFERQRYNKEIDKRNEIIKGLREDIEYLKSELDRHIKMLEK